jgi:uncharacterized membrane protein
MSFDHDVHEVVQVVEGIGVAVLVLGALFVLGRSAVLYLIPDRRKGAWVYARRHLGRVLLLGLEILIISDIINTVIVEPTASSVLVLGTIVIIRILLSWSLDVEIDGVWPWRKHQLSSERAKGAEEEG